MATAPKPDPKLRPPVSEPDPARLPYGMPRPDSDENKDPQHYARVQPLI